MATDRLQDLIDRSCRVQEVLNASGEFWVEAAEIDGVTTWRADVSDRSTGKWFTLTVEADDDETEGAE